MILTSTIRCPRWGFTQSETMPTTTCQIVYDCPPCYLRLRPKAGDCCVFCSYGDLPCPSKQKHTAAPPDRQE